MSQPPQEQRMPLDAIIPCKYLFKVTTEFPQFVPPYRWWEDESTTVLWAFQKEARLVIRYALLRNQNLLRSMLLSRNPEAIDTIINLIKPDEQQYNTHLSHESKVKKILDQSCLPPFNPIPWPCFPQSDQSLDAQAIAQSIETQSHFQLRTIAFEDIVRASLGYPATSVEWFLRVHTELYVRLLAHLQIHTEEIPVYEEVEKVCARPLVDGVRHISTNSRQLLQTQSPFAHRAVLQSLVDLGLVNAPGLPQPPMHSFDFIARPIQILFQYRPYSLTEILKICELFAFRFKRDYINAATVPWKKPFDSTFSFLEECFISSSASDLARTLTDMDKGDFANLSQQSIMAQDTIVTDFLDNWNALTVSVWEVLCAIPDLAPYLQECAQVSHIDKSGIYTK